MTGSLSRIVNDQNTWLNTHGGPIKRSTFIKTWHELDNEFFLDTFRDALHINETTKYVMPYRLQKNIEICAQHIFDYGSYHNNILNPEPKDMEKLPKYATHLSRDLSVKSVFWNTMMQLREYYNTAHNIPITNTAADRGILKSTRDIFGELFDVR